MYAPWQLHDNWCFRIFGRIAARTRSLILYFFRVHAVLGHFDFLFWYRPRLITRRNA